MARGVEAVTFAEGTLTAVGRVAPALRSGFVNGRGSFCMVVALLAVESKKKKLIRKKTKKIAAQFLITFSFGEIW